MSRLQRKQLESRLVLLVLLLTACIFQEKPLIARSVFLPAIVYLILNWDIIRYIDSVKPNALEILQTRRGMQIWLLFGVGLQLVVPYFFLFTNRDLGKVLTGVGSLFVAVSFPFWPALISSEFEKFRRLGSDLGEPPWR